MRRPGHSRDARSGSPLSPTPQSIFGASSVRLDLRRSLGITYGTPPAVAAWADQSNSTNDAAQGTAGSRPSLTSEGVDFDGTDDHLVVTDDASLDLTTGMTIGLRVRLDTVVADQVLLSKCEPAGGSWVLQLVGSQSRIWVRFGDTLRYGRLSAMSSGTWYSLVIVYDGSQVVANDRLKAWWNGTQDSGIAYTSTIASTIPVTAYDVVIGRWATDVQKMNGSYRSLVIASTAANAGQIAALTSYLNGT